MTTIGKRSSPKKNKGLRKAYFPKRYHSPEKDVKGHRAEDEIAALRKVRIANGSVLKATRLSYSKSSSLSPQLKKIMTLNPLKRKKSSSLPESPKKRTYTRSTVSDGSPNPRTRKSRTPITVPSTTPTPTPTPTPEPVADDEVPSYELCAFFGFYGRKAEVARTMLRIWKQLLRLTEAKFIDAYANNTFMKLFEEVTATGVKVAKGDIELWDDFLHGIKRLLEMRLNHFGVSAFRLRHAIDSHDVSEWGERMKGALASGNPGKSLVRLFPKSGLLKDLYEIAVNLHKQIKAVEEFDREDAIMDVESATEEGILTSETVEEGMCTDLKERQRRPY